MPGTHLSNPEDRLIKDWNQRVYRQPRLASVRIEGAGGVRGIRSLTLACDRPITALCGPSGAGKSTLLELCALAFRSPASPTPDTATDFDNSFVSSASESPFSDFTVTWHYVGGTQPAVTLDGADRSLSSDRPTRPVVLVSAARLVPARVQPQLVAQFGAASTTDAEGALSAPFLKRLNDVLQTPYRATHWQRSAAFELDTCTTGATYSSFNMALAEQSVLHIFRQLYTAPTQSLVIIEDIEAALHPSTNERLAKNLVDICLEKSLQIVLSVRSTEFLDNLPRAFRALLEFDGANHTITDGPPIRQIKRAIGLVAPPDVAVFCEDDRAEAIILAAVDGELRRRLKIIRAGSKTVLAQFAYSHHKSNWGHKILIVWDGDVPDGEITKWLRSLDPSKNERQALSRIRLPGTEPPERWLIDQLRQPEGAKLLAAELNEDEREAQMMLNIVAATAEHHNMFRELSSHSQLDEEHVLAAVARATRHMPHQPLAALSDQISRVAHSESVVAVGLWGDEADAE